MKQMNRQEVLFYSGYVFYLTAACFLGNIYSPISKCFKLIGIVFLFIACFNAFLRNNNNIFFKNVVFIGYIILLGLTIDIKLPVLFVFVYAFRNCNFAKLIKLDFGVRLLGFVGTVGSCKLGIADDYILSMYRGNELVNRHSLGYAHPNNCFLMFFIIVVDYILLKRLNHKRIKFLDLMLIVLTASVVNYFTDSRAGFGLVILLTVAVFLESLFGVCKKNKWLAKILCYSSLGGMVASIILVAVYEKLPTIGNVLNNFFTKRISSMSYFYHEYGIRLFGNVTKRVSTAEAMATGTRALVLDNLYANLLICYGLIFCVFYIWWHIKLNHFLMKAKRYEYLLIFSVFSIYGLFEGVALNIDYYYFIVLVSSLFFNKTLDDVKDILIVHDKKSLSVGVVDI